MIDERTLRILEFDKIVARLADHASFSAGKEAALALRPSVRLDEARAGGEQTAEASRFVAAHPNAHLGGAHDIRPAVRRAEIGSVLMPAELLDVGSTLIASGRVRSALRSTEIDLPWLKGQGERLVEGRDLVHALDSTFNDRGDILDSASPTLRRIRSDIAITQGRVTDRLNSMVASDYRTALQEPIVTMRNGRYVIPVRQDARARVPGIVHDQSASGQTIFVEPLVVTELNNRLRELQLDEQREVERILAELSARVAAMAPGLRDTVEALRDMDLAFAKAAYAGATRASQPRLNADGELALLEARHPLLTGSPVPISVWLGKDFRVLVITGPNTGGKTVALKTVGLLTLMAQAGMHIPAAEGSEVAVFPRIFADIGDEQSIEQSLSTFSSHMSTIIDTLPKVDATSLVLLDELGAGTDPTEGAALARAILEALLESGARGVVTTHYSELKTFAHSVEGAENASVEFDVSTLSPTYRLIIGLPGRSQALAIAKRLGLPGAILEGARQQLSTGAVRVEQMLAQIQGERQEIARLFSRTRELHADARKLRDRLQAEVRGAQADRARVLEEAREEGAAVVRELRARLRQIEEEAGTARRGTRQWREQIEVAQEEAAERLGPVETAGGAALVPIRAGVTVAIPSLGQQGTVLSVEGGEAEVQMGQFKMRLPVDDLEPMAGTRRVPEPAVQYQAAGPAPALEIDVRGWRAEDALRELDQYLHDNYVHGQGTVRIVHGKGTGALRKAIREQLRDHPLVKGFGSEKSEAGGEGVTVVQLAT